MTQVDADAGTLSLLSTADEQPFLVLEGQVFSRRDIAVAVRRCISWLLAAGVMPGQQLPLSFLASPTPATLVLMLAAVELGVPIFPLHTKWTDHERATLLAKYPLKWLQHETIERLPPHGGLNASAPWSTSEPFESPLPRPEGEQILAVVLTSGSTGAPKAVQLSRRAFLASARASACNLGRQERERWLLCLPLAHIGGLSIITRCLVDCAAVSLPTPHDRFTQPDSLYRELQESSITTVSLVPTLLERLLALGQPCPQALRAVLLGGAPASLALLEQATHAGWPILTTYGLTEACSQVCTQTYGTVNLGEQGCGRSLGLELRFVDHRIWLRGDTLLSGYYPRGNALDGGWFQTSDFGRIDSQGNLHVLGRTDDVIISGGENVHPREVEAALEQDERVSRACVLGIEDPRWGQRIVAAVVPAQEPTRSALAQIQQGLSQLAPYKRPKRYAWVEKLPETASHKLDRHAAATAFTSLFKGLP